MRRLLPLAVSTAPWAVYIYICIYIYILRIRAALAAALLKAACGSSGGLYRSAVFRDSAAPGAKSLESFLDGILPLAPI